MCCVIIVRGMLANWIHANTLTSWKVQGGAPGSLPSSKCNLVCLSSLVSALPSLQKLLCPIYAAQVWFSSLEGGSSGGISGTPNGRVRGYCAQRELTEFERQEEIIEPIFSIETQLLVSSKSVSLVFERINLKECSSDVVSGPTASESGRELTQNADFWVLNQSGESDPLGVGSSAFRRNSPSLVHNKKLENHWHYKLFPVLSFNVFVSKRRWSNSDEILDQREWMNAEIKWHMKSLMYFCF